MKLFLSIIALAFGSVSGFALHPRSHARVDTALKMKVGGKEIATAVLAGSLLAVSAFGVPEDANAMIAPDFGSTQIVAARSGGRAGGRASYARPSSRSYAAPPRTTYRSSTTIVRPMIAPPPVMVSPFGMGYGYSPLGGGFGLGYGLGALNSAGSGIRDYRQDREIVDSQLELQQAKAREAELESRIKALEQAQQVQQQPLPSITEQQAVLTTP